MKRISITFEDEAAEKIEAMAKSERRSFSNMTCVLADEAIERREDAAEAEVV